MRKRRLFWVMVAGLVVGGIWVGLHYIPGDFAYEVEAEFVAVPADDAALEEWLQSQPGVWKAMVSRERAGERTRVVVILGMTQNGWSQPPFPDLEQTCEALGYTGSAGSFHDTRPR